MRYINNGGEVDLVINNQSIKTINNINRVHTVNNMLPCDGLKTLSAKYILLIMGSAALKLLQFSRKTIFQKSWVEGVSKLINLLSSAPHQAHSHTRETPPLPSRNTIFI